MIAASSSAYAIGKPKHNLANPPLPEVASSSAPYSRSLEVGHLSAYNDFFLSCVRRCRVFFSVLVSVRVGVVPTSNVQWPMFQWTPECLERGMSPDITFGPHFRLAPKRVDFWSSFSYSGGSFVSFLAHFSSLGSTLAALGAHFLITKTV